MGIIETIALSMGLGWASGLNLYATLFVLGALQTTGTIELPPDLALVADPFVLGAAGFMYCVEFFADKLPGVDSGWDALHSFIRVPAGAVLAAQAVGSVDPATALAAGLLGGTLAAGTHSLKAGTRIALNASPEPVTNWTASVTEDVLVVGGLFAALHHPLLFLALLIVFIAISLWALSHLWRGAKARFTRFRRSFDTNPETAALRAHPDI